MVIKFLFKTSEEQRELANIVKVESAKAFPPEDIYCIYENCSTSQGGYVYINIKNSVYVKNIQESISKLAEMEHPYMTDFLSEVQENLSFVPKIEVE